MIYKIDRMPSGIPTNEVPYLQIGLFLPLLCTRRLVLTPDLLTMAVQLEYIQRAESMLSIPKVLTNAY